MKPEIAPDVRWDVPLEGPHMDLFTDDFSCSELQRWAAVERFQGHLLISCTKPSLVATGLSSQLGLSRHLQAQRGWLPSAECFVVHAR